MSKVTTTQKKEEAPEPNKEVVKEETKEPKKKEEATETDHTVTVKPISFGSNTNEIVDDAIEFEVNYSKDFKGIKYFENGQVVKVSVQSAKEFEQRGIGKIKK